MSATLPQAVPTRLPSGPCRLRWLGLLLLGALQLAVMPLADSAPDEKKLHISGSTWIHDAPTRIAHQAGYFDAIEPQIVTERQDSGRASLERLLDGEVEFALVAATPVARALLEHAGGHTDHDDPPVVIASFSLSSQTHHVLAANEEISTPRDLEGSRIGLLFDTSADFFWSLFTTTHDVDTGNVERVEIPLDEMATALASGKVDAVVTWDPWAHHIDREFGHSLVRFSDRDIYTLNWLLVSRRSVLDQHTDAAARVLDAYAQAMAHLHAAPEDDAAYFTEDTGLPEEYLREMRDHIIFHLRLDWSVLNALERKLSWFMEQDPERYDRRPDPARYLHPGPMRASAPESLKLPDLWLDRDDSP